MLNIFNKTIKKPLDFLIEDEGESSNQYHDFVSAKGLFRWVRCCYRSRTQICNAVDRIFWKKECVSLIKLQT